MVGAITYDAVRRWERVPDAGRDELDLPELAMMLATDLAVFDHSDGSLLLVANAVNYDATDERIEEAWADAVGRLDRMTAELADAGAEHRRDDRADRERAAQQPHAGAVRGHGRAGQGGDPGGRGVPDRRLAALHRAVPGRLARRLPRAAGQQPEPVHVPPAPAAPRRLGLRRRRLEPRGARQGDRPPGDHPPDRRVAAARQEPRPRRAPRRGAARRRQGAGRAPHARRPRAQRPPADLPRRHGRHGRLHVGAPLQPHHAHRVDGRRRPARRPRAPTTPSSRPSRRAR